MSHGTEAYMLACTAFTQKKNEMKKIIPELLRQLTQIRPDVFFSELGKGFAQSVMPLSLAKKNAGTIHYL